MISKDLPGSEPDVTYGYDLLGRMTSAATTAQTVRFEFDSLGRRLKEIQPHGTVRSEWDVAGRRTRLIYPDNYYVDYDHLVTGEMTRIRENGANVGDAVLATFDYDDLGRRSSLVRGNGATTSYDYDGVSRLIALGHDFAGAAHDLTLGFTYNPAGQIVANSRSNELYSWNGHATADVGDSHDGLNRIDRSGAAAMAYDARGNIVSDGTQSYSYSSENRLTRVVTPSWTVDLNHDPLGRYNGYSSIGNRQNASDGGQLIYLKKDNAFLTRTVFGPGIDEPLYYIDNQGRRNWTAADERGSIVATANAAGTVGWTGRYDEYGNYASRAYEFGFAGSYWHTPVNLHYMRARWYHPKLGRFLQPDPIGYGGGMNMYAYVGGDPVNLTDPLGLDEQVITVTAIGGAGTGPSVSVMRPMEGSSGVWDRVGNLLFAGDQPAQQTPAKCKLGKGAIDVSFDGTTLNITAKINLVGPGAATSSAYIGGIGKAWTRSYGHINSIANISAGPGGITAHITSEKFPLANEQWEAGPRGQLGGNAIRLGNLGAMDDWARPFAIAHTGPHEFGHPFGIDNMPNVGKWKGSIMANAANNVSPTDLERVVELCRAAQ